MLCAVKFGAKILPVYGPPDIKLNDEFNFFFLGGGGGMQTYM